MFAFWNYNLCQELSLGFPALGLPKFARGLLKKTTLHTLQIDYDMSDVLLIFVCLLKSDCGNSPFTMPIIVHHA